MLLCHGTRKVKILCPVEKDVSLNLRTDEGSSFSAKGNTVVVNGEYKKDTKTSENAAEQYDPYHSQLIHAPYPLCWTP